METTSYVAVKALRQVRRLEGQIRALKQELIRSVSGTAAARPAPSVGRPLRGLIKGAIIGPEDIEAAKRSLFSAGGQDRR